MMKPELTCFPLLPKPGTRNKSLRISPLPTFGKNFSSICSTFLEVKLNPDPSAALIITKKTPLSSFGSNSFLEIVNRRKLAHRTKIRKIIILFFLDRTYSNVSE